MEPHCNLLLLNIMHCTPQDAAQQKEDEKAEKLAKAERLKAEEQFKKKAKTINDLLSSPMLLFEAAVHNFNNNQAAGQESFLLNSSILLLNKVKDWVAQAGAAMLGNGPTDAAWNMEEIKLAKSQMVANTRTAWNTHAHAPTPPTPAPFYIDLN
jgi:hypothetical protein